MNDYIYLITPAVAYIIGQFLKAALELRKDGVTFSDAVASGGMPSVHTATMVALLTVIGDRHGITSVIFGLAATVTAIVAYDAVGVRRTAGEAALAARELQHKAKGTHQVIHVMRGHSPVQVLAGAVLGFVVGFILTKSL